MISPMEFIFDLSEEFIFRISEVGLTIKIKTQCKVDRKSFINFKKIIYVCLNLKYQ